MSPAPRRSAASKAHVIIKIIFRVIGILVSLAALILMVYTIIKWRKDSQKNEKVHPVYLNIAGFICIGLSVLNDVLEVATNTAFTRLQAPFVIGIDFVAMGAGIGAVFEYGTAIFDDVDLSVMPWIRIERIIFRMFEAIVTLRLIFVVWTSVGICVRRRSQRKRARAAAQVGMPMY